MNLNQLERLLLLEQSGEISPKQRRALDAELGASAGARRQRDQIRGFAASVPSSTATPSPGTVQRIHARLQSRPTPSPIFHPVWKSALASAAALALLIGVHAYRSSTNPIPSEPAVASVTTASEEEWTDPLDSEFTELESLIATFSTDNTFEMTEI